MRDSNLVVLNGTDGINEVLTGMLGQAFAVFGALREGVTGVAAGSPNGGDPARPTSPGAEAGPVPAKGPS